MVVVDRVKASRESERWGFDKPTHKEAMLASLANSSLSYADSGTLSRIAIALERIADVLDPDVREATRIRKAEEAEWAAKDKLKKQEAEKNLPAMRAALDEWESRNASALGKIRPRLRSTFRNGFAKTIGQYHHWGYESYREEFHARIVLDIPAILDTKLYGIGPATLQYIRADLAKAEMPSEATP